MKKILTVLALAALSMPAFAQAEVKVMRNAESSVIMPSEDDPALTYDASTGYYEGDIVVNKRFTESTVYFQLYSQEGNDITYYGYSQILGGVQYNAVQQMSFSAVGRSIVLPILDLNATGAAYGYWKETVEVGMHPSITGCLWINTLPSTANKSCTLHLKFKPDPLYLEVTCAAVSDYYGALWVCGGPSGAADMDAAYKNIVLYGDPEQPTKLTCTYDVPELAGGFKFFLGTQPSFKALNGFQPAEGSVNLEFTDKDDFYTGQWKAGKGDWAYLYNYGPMEFEYDVATNVLTVRPGDDFGNSDDVGDGDYTRLYVAYATGQNRTLTTSANDAELVYNEATGMFEGEVTLYLEGTEQRAVGFYTGSAANPTWYGVNQGGMGKMLTFNSYTLTQQLTEGASNGFYITPTGLPFGYDPTKPFTMNVSVPKGWKTVEFSVEEFNPTNFYVWGFNGEEWVVLSELKPTEDFTYEAVISAPKSTGATGYSVLIGVSYSELTAGSFGVVSLDGEDNADVKIPAGDATFLTLSFTTSPFFFVNEGTYRLVFDYDTLFLEIYNVTGEMEPDPPFTVPDDPNEPDDPNDNPDNPDNAVDSINADNADATYYTLQGVKVAHPDRGLYIRVSNGKAEKVRL
ncbi:MAG: hypothetical protein J1E97_07560 [Muribaculaceae bacterium]|nr:hypothetical protein [Muribaculaceae bacterium]